MTQILTQPITHLTTAELEAGLDTIRQSSRIGYARPHCAPPGDR
ncbi:MAG: hypothetical protein R2867_47315 [Caldilineaceae bacterium]